MVLSKKVNIQPGKPMNIDQITTSNSEPNDEPTTTTNFQNSGTEQTLSSSNLGGTDLSRWRLRYWTESTRKKTSYNEINLTLTREIFEEIRQRRINPQTVNRKIQPNDVFSTPNGIVPQQFINEEITDETNEQLFGQLFFNETELQRAINRSFGEANPKDRTFHEYNRKFFKQIKGTNVLCKSCLMTIVIEQEEPWEYTIVQTEETRNHQHKKEEYCNQCHKLVKTKEFFPEQEESYQQKLEKLINLEGQEYKQKVITLIDKAQQVAQDESRKNLKTQQYQKITWVKNCKACDYCAKYKKKYEYQNNQEKCNCVNIQNDNNTTKEQGLKTVTIVIYLKNIASNNQLKKSVIPALKKNYRVPPPNQNKQIITIVKTCKYQKPKKYHKQNNSDKIKVEEINKNCDNCIQKRIENLTIHPEEEIGQQIKSIKQLFEEYQNKTFFPEETNLNKLFDQFTKLSTEDNNPWEPEISIEPITSNKKLIRPPPKPRKVLEEVLNGDLQNYLLLLLRESKIVKEYQLRRLHTILMSITIDRYNPEYLKKVLQKAKDNIIQYQQQIYTKEKLITKLKELEHQLPLGISVRIVLEEILKQKSLQKLNKLLKEINNHLEELNEQ
ncbi:1788_t:CDS:2 [Ambispora leptoticha]|uniref:1788_t:CDS:1 n=1 Tax=Ambispora leptoticha TaxID=144679 RepID=A0A9N9GDZ4_9GLOM|nr:1788_t:CDS:2 [Ambispora leptoticha]